MEGKGALLKENGAPVRIRISNLLIRSQVLYPVELRAHICKAERGGPYLGSPLKDKSFLAKGLKG